MLQLRTKFTKLRLKLNLYVAPKPSQFKSNKKMVEKSFLKAWSRIKLSIINYHKMLLYTCWNTSLPPLQQRWIFRKQIPTILSTIFPVCKKIASTETDKQITAQQTNVQIKRSLCNTIHNTSQTINNV